MKLSPGISDVLREARRFKLIQDAADKFAQMIPGCVEMTVCWRPDYVCCPVVDAYISDGVTVEEVMKAYNAFYNWLCKVDVENLICDVSFSPMWGPP